MRWLTCLLLFSFSAIAYGQHCNCRQELAFVERDVERNLPAYRDQVENAGRLSEYVRHKELCNNIAGRTKDGKECTYLAAKYISFFRDEHLRINFKDGYFPFKSLADTGKVRSFFRRERAFDIHGMDKGTAVDGISGYWRSRDGNYLVRVVPKKSDLTDYVGLIVDADPLFWSRGQVKFTLKKVGDQLESLYLIASRQPRYFNAAIAGSTLTIGRMNVFDKVDDTESKRKDIEVFHLADSLEFRELSDATNCLRVPSFDLGLATAIDSLVARHLGQILSKPNLIIDVRNNGGGGDRSYQALLPLVFESKRLANPLRPSIFATPDILKYCEQTRYDNCDNREDSTSSDSTISLMKRSLNRYTPLEPDTLTVDTVYSAVKKVAIITNRMCASAGEGFLLQALQSGKVVLCGENTLGCFAYGDWRKVELPCLPIMVTVATKKENLDWGEDYEGTGIPPQLRLDPSQERNWITQVEAALEK